LYPPCTPRAAGELLLAQAEDAVEQFSWRNIAEQTLALYQTLV
jgi:glycosyltransferase involved in cell wall biosynthesis